MDPTKTRIWNADDLGLPRAPARAANVTPPSPARRASKPPPPPPPRKARASSAPPPPSTLTARWSASGAQAPGPLASTRIMPIETLLPALPEAAAQRKQPTRRLATLKRIAGHVLLAALTVLAVALWKLPLGQYVRARSSPPPAALPVAGEAAAPAPETTVSAAPALAAARPRAVASKHSVASLQREAVELVIAGDFSAAEEVYRRLASDNPEADAYLEAARMLSARRGR